MNTAPKIHLAPLQGFTDKAYRNALFSHIGGIDVYYTPYISVANSGEIQGAEDLEVSSIEEKECLVPQILPGNMEEAKILGDFVLCHGYSSININCGCPYPMVTGKGRGSGLMVNPDLVSRMANYLESTLQLNVSLKMRLGLNAADEIENFLERIAVDSIAYIIVHPRTASQLYRGRADVERFAALKNEYRSFRFVYNGDIVSLNDYHKVESTSGSLSDVMLGRGILMDPILGNRIRGESDSEKQFDKKYHDFILLLIKNIIAESSDAGHALNRLKHQFDYLLRNKPELKRVSKKIKKAKCMDEVIQYLADIDYIN